MLLPFYGNSPVAVQCSTPASNATSSEGSRNSAIMPKNTFDHRSVAADLPVPWFPSHTSSHINPFTTSIPPITHHSFVTHHSYKDSTLLAPILLRIIINSQSPTSPSPSPTPHTIHTNLTNTILRPNLIPRDIQPADIPTLPDHTLGWSSCCETRFGSSACPRSRA